MFTEEDGFNPFDRMTQLRLGSHTRDMIARAKSEITDLRAHGLYLVDDLVLCHIQPRVGQSLWYVVQQPSQFRAGQEFFSSLSNQISELITRHHLARATMHDELTGLFNRSFLKSRIEVELRLAAARHRPLSALVLEPARHEALVRLHGEANAQRVLLRMAEVALDLVRDGDFAARLNESQLAILLPNTNDRDATALAQRFQERIAVDPIVMSPSPGHDHQVEIHPQIDFGVAEADLSDSSMDLLEEASKVLVLSRHTVRGAA
jgi:diguanylate cyclase (GGDEF)-like protein